MSIQDTFQKCANILGVETDRFTKIFQDEETTKAMLSVLSLDELTTFMSGEFTPSTPPDGFQLSIYNSKLKMVSGLLLSVVRQEPVVISEQKKSSDQIISLVKDMRPLANWSDREVLQAYIDSPSDELESQLTQRSKGRRFIVTNPTESDNIDLEQSLIMLKRARKEYPPEFYRTSDGKVIYIYQLNELNRKSRTRHQCPVCGKILFDSHCESCDINFNGIGERERKFIAVAVSMGSKSITVDKIVSVANEGFNRLMDLFPLVYKHFIQLEVENRLPSLIRLEKPISANYNSDPFKVTGNRG